MSLRQIRQIRNIRQGNSVGKTLKVFQLCGSRFSNYHKLLHTVQKSVTMFKIAGQVVHQLSNLAGNWNRKKIRDLKLRQIFVIF